MKDNCGKQGSQSQLLRARLWEGVGKLKKRSAGKNCTVTASDKGGDLVIASLDVYTKQVREHIGDDKTIRREEARVLLRQMFSSSSSCSIIK